MQPPCWKAFLLWAADQHSRRFSYPSFQKASVSLGGCSGHQPCSISVTSSSFAGERQRLCSWLQASPVPPCCQASANPHVAAGTT